MLVEGYAGAREITVKGARDIVTATDVAVEDLVRRHLGDVLGRPVVGEERGGEPPADGSPYWLVDPICGTTNFASGIPLFCVNLALVENNEVTVAVVGDMMKLFLASLTLPLAWTLVRRFKGKS